MTESDARPAARDVEPDLAQPLELVPFRIRHPEQLADRQARHGKGEVLDQVDRSLLSDPAPQVGDRLRDDRRHGRFEGLQPTAREVGREHLPQAGVVRRVREAEATRVESGRGPVTSHEVVEVVAVGVVVGEYLAHLVVAGDQPSAEPPRQGNPADRSFRLVQHRIQSVAPKGDEDGLRHQRQDVGTAAGPAQPHGGTQQSPSKHSVCCLPRSSAG